MDKGASALSAWPALGFSWVEYGGITRFPQEGNPKPRMFRADAEQALVNSMGFNNPGASSIRDHLINRRAAGKWPNVPVAANIGRSKKVDNSQAPSDYSATLETLWDHADFFVLNISSPNTPGLRDLHEESSLSSVLRACNSVRETKGGGKQILLKLSPDASDEDLVATSEEALKNGVDGIVATNTTLKRPIPKNTKSRHAFAQNGGVSGRPLQSRSLDVVSMLYESTNGKVPIVGVGGIDSADSAWNSVTSGASLLQLYSALIFRGPSVVSSIVRGLRSRVRENGFSSIDEAVGYNNV
jgi:dihydroorotate dehydrogenase